MVWENVPKSKRFLEISEFDMQGSRIVALKKWKSSQEFSALMLVHKESQNMLTAALKGPFISESVQRDFNHDVIVFGNTSIETSLQWVVNRWDSQIEHLAFIPGWHRPAVDVYREFLHMEPHTDPKAVDISRLLRLYPNLQTVMFFDNVSGVLRHGERTAPNRRLVIDETEGRVDSEMCVEEVLKFIRLLINNSPPRTLPAVKYQIQDKDRAQAGI